MNDATLDLFRRLNTGDTLDAIELPQPKLKTLLVAANKAHAEQLRQNYADVSYMREREITNVAWGSPSVYVTFPGDVLTGRRFTNVVVFDRVLHAIKLSQKAWDWYHEVILTRIAPQGGVKVIAG